MIAREIGRNPENTKLGLPMSVLTPSVWVGLLFAVAVVQYLPAAISTAASGEEIYWSLNPDAMADSGMLRFGKDATLLLFSIYWPVRLLFLARSPPLKDLAIYALWMLGLVVLGLIPYALEYNVHPQLILAGLRWMLVLHGAYGITLLLQHTRDTKAGHTFTVGLLLALSVVDLLLVAKQGVSSGLSSLSGVRLPGAFGVAGTAGYFAVAAAIVAKLCDRAPLSARVGLLACAFLIAATSGTRFAMICIGLVAITWSFQLVKTARSQKLQMRVIIAGIAAAPFLVLLVIAGVASADRGNPFDQTGDGARLSNLALLVREINNAPIGEVLLGDGLGTGTNAGTAMTDQFPVARWDTLIDNTIATTFFQVGVIGVIYVFAGILVFCTNRSVQPDVLIVIVLSFFTQNLFEQYFLMLAFAFAFTQRRDVAKHGSRFYSANGGPSREYRET